MSFIAWFRPPRHLLLLFLAVTLLPAMGLIWLGWRLLQQDRELMAQRIQEAREQAADRIVAALQQKLLDAERQLSESAAHENPLPGDDALVVVLTLAKVVSFTGDGLLFYPYLSPGKEAPERLFRAGEDYEFRLQDHAGAIANLRELAGSQDRSIRAGALLRIARNLRKAGQPEAALAVYQELARQEGASIGGIPAELLARRARCALLAELKRDEELRREAAALYAALSGGRWQLDRAVYLVHAQDVRNWIRIDEDREQERLALAAGAAWLWERWQAVSRDPALVSGRQSLAVEGRLITILWQAAQGRLVGLIAGPRYAERKWIEGLHPILETRNSRLWLRDPDDLALLGAPLPANAQLTLRAPRDTGLPWTVALASADPDADIDPIAARRRLLLAGLLLVTILVFAGSYFTARAFLRELAAARLQSDFVSAVSHEFRTPLASLRQLTENLLDGRVTTDERRQSYYQGQARATDRLHRLVEGLLDFGRMEAGVLRYRLEPLDAVEWVRSVTAEFLQELADGGHGVEFDAAAGPLVVRGDREALTRALWNLMDNAVKYSPGSPTIRIELAREQDGVAIRVCDRGLGIAPEEQKEIYRKFYRGSAARAAGVKGTGIGLALVQHIVRAHGGEVRLESAPGAGSTFTLMLPAITDSPVATTRGTHDTHSCG